MVQSLLSSLNRPGTWASVLALTAVIAVTVKMKVDNYVAAVDFSNVGEPRDMGWWMPLHNQFLAEIDENTEGFGLIFFGDSITESWRGTMGNSKMEAVEGNRQVFDSRFRERWRAVPFGLSGDRTTHLLWRLNNGELPLQKPPRVALLLIGTNDLGHAAHFAKEDDFEATILAAVPEVAANVLRTVQLIQYKAPSTQVVLLALLPRGNHQDGFKQPGPFTAALDEVNAHFKEFATQDGRIHYLDCGATLLTPDGSAVDGALMPDGLHPNGAGAAALAGCLEPALEKLMG